MTAKRNPLFRPSVGERQLMQAYAIAAGAGALVGVFFLYDSLADRFSLSIFRAWLGVAGALGAVGSLYIMRSHFGKTGPLGTAQAIFSGVMATLLTGIIGGTVALPVYGTMFGAWLVIASFIQNPILLLPWAAGIYAVHRAFLVYRKERDTIFAWAPETPAE